MVQSPKEIIFHIGPHKTGTTYIQKMFVENRRSLADKGIYYPEEGIGPQFGHHQIVKDFNTQGFSSSLSSALEYPQFHTVIFSSENFDQFRQLQLDALKKELPKDVKVSFVYFIRRPHELLISSWQENIKHGGEKPWAEYFLEHTLRPYSSSVLNHFMVLKHYGEAFGFNSIHLVDYNYLIESGADIFSFLLDYLGCGLPDAKSDMGKSINKSLPYADAEIFRVLNVLCKLRLGDSRLLSKIPEIRRFDAFVSDRKELKKIVSLRMVNVEMNNLYFVLAMRKYFQQKLIDCVWATPSAEDNGEADYLLPDASWVFQDQAVNHLENMFKLIFNAVQGKAAGVNA